MKLKLTDERARDLARWLVYRAIAGKHSVYWFREQVINNFEIPEGVRDIDQQIWIWGKSGWTPRYLSDLKERERIELAAKAEALEKRRRAARRLAREKREIKLFEVFKKETEEWLEEWTIGSHSKCPILLQTTLPRQGWEYVGNGGFQRLTQNYL